MKRAPGAARAALAIAAWSVSAVSAPCAAHAQADSVTAQVIDDFERGVDWTAHPSDGVSMRLAPSLGRRGGGMRMDFDFHGGAGYAIARKAVRLTLPANYALSFDLRADSPTENLELKLIDSTGDNVWWRNRQDYTFPRTWTRLTTKRRDIVFAWGPASGGEARAIAAIEIVVTAGTGRKGTVWIDDVTLTPLEPDRPYDLVPRVTASSSAPGQDAARALDGDSLTAWRSIGAGAQWLTIDFGRRREYGGLTLDWAPGGGATRYAVEGSGDGVHWDTLRVVARGNGGRDYVRLPEAESRWVRLALTASPHGQAAYALREIRVEPPDVGATQSAFFRRVARDAPRGTFPRYLSDEQPFWTVVGVNGGRRTSLLDSDGMVEPDPGGYSIQPFLLADGRRYSWANVQSTQRLEPGALTIPTVAWRAGDVGLEITAFATGAPDASQLWVRYRVRNERAEPASVTLALVLRPLQVNPPWQFLGIRGGAADIHAVARDGSGILVNGDRRIVPQPLPTSFGAAAFDEGDAAEDLRGDSVRGHTSVADSTGSASAVLAWALTVAPAAHRDIVLRMPARGRGRAESPAAAFAAATRYWQEQLDRVTIRLPDAGRDVVETLRSNLAYILIERDGPIIRPGARSYARAWIRDGTMIGAALLRLGHSREVREFLEWYARFQYPSGKVPCCVGAHGADPVPENDSHGQLIYGIAEYFRFTHDRAFLVRMWPAVERSVAYIDSLRASRRTPRYDAPDSLVFRGLVPESISHEGYSAKPEHSYWDDFFTLKGLADAAELASALGKTRARDAIAADRDAFARDLFASIALAMRTHGIDYIPGSAELGDFDATSTTVAVEPAGAAAGLPPGALGATFERYWRETRVRRDSSAWESYTPYELRTVGTFVRLGWRDRALDALAGFFADQRPRGWHVWAEVVWRDSTTPKFIGDMPHAWVASDYIRSALDIFAYERASDSALVIGAGVPWAWVHDRTGVLVRGLHTAHGSLTYTMRGAGDSVVVRLGGGVAVPPGGIAVRSPIDHPSRATVDGVVVPVAEAGEIIVRRVPAAITLRR